MNPEQPTALQQELIQQSRLARLVEAVTSHGILKATMAASLVLGAMGLEATPVGEQVTNSIEEATGVNINLPLGRATEAGAVIDFIDCDIGVSFTHDLFLAKHFGGTDRSYWIYDFENNTPKWIAFQWDMLQSVPGDPQASSFFIPGSGTKFFPWDENGNVDIKLWDENGNLMVNESFTKPASCTTPTTTAPPTTVAPTTTKVPPTTPPPATTPPPSTTQAPPTTETPTTTTIEAITTTVLPTTIEAPTTTTVVPTTTQRPTTTEAKVLSDSTTSETTTTINSNKDSSNQEQDSKPLYPPFVNIGGLIIAVVFTEEYLRRNRGK